jgi:hypothetical protein
VTTMLKVPLDLVIWCHGYRSVPYDDSMENYVTLIDHLVGQAGLCKQLAKYIC